MDDNSSDENSVEEWILYKNRPEWKDIESIPQDDGPYPVVSINYSERYSDVFNYFRGVVAKNEKSIRVLMLCRDALTLSPANYTVWQYRRLVLKHLNSDLKEELEYVADVISNHSKNYQVWHHRRVIIEWYGDATNELAFTEQMLQIDAKNYHAWQYRQWVLTTFKCFQNELAFVNEMLKNDVRNNSVWNHRYFILNISEEGFSSKIISEEINYIIDKLQICLNNESVWNYLRGILLHCDSEIIKSKIVNFCTELYEKDHHGDHSVHLFAFLADNAVETVENKTENSKENIKFALKLYNDLALKYDIIRISYWKFIIQELCERYSLEIEI